MTAPLNNLTDTWNNAGTVFTALKYNITNSASAAGSLLFDFQVGGSSLIRGDKTGVLHAGPAAGGGIIVWGGDDTRGVYAGNGAVLLSNSASVFFAGANSHGVGWDLTTDVNAAFSWNGQDTNLYRDAANIIAQRTTTSAQTLRVYNTFTDASNYERGVFDWTTTANVLTIGPQNAGTGTARSIAFTSASAWPAPATKTTTYSQAVGDRSLIFNGSGSITLTLLTASSFPGLELWVRTIASQAVVSATSNVVPVAGGAAGTAILSATAGKWAKLVSDGTNWQIMASN
jgi:hypothetical protein